MKGKLMLVGLLVIGGLLVAGSSDAVCQEECPPSPTPTPTPTFSPRLTPTPTFSPTPTPTPEEEKSDDPGDEQDCETSTNVDACGEGYTNEEPKEPAPVPQVKGIETRPSPTPAPEVVEELEEFPSTGASLLLPLVLAGSWLGVATVGLKKKW